MGGLAAIAGPILSIGGGLISGSKAADAAKGNAEALRAAADKASGMAQFKPMGMTTRFGTSTFADDGTGGYQLSPELQLIQNRLFDQTGGYDPTRVASAAEPLYSGASSAFNRGQYYLGQDPTEVAQKYIADQQALLAPSREASFNRLNTTNFGRGTGGLAVNTGTGGAPSNPLAQAYFNQIGQQDLELAAKADQAAMDRAKFGIGLFGTGSELLGQLPKLTTAGYGPLEAQLGLLRTTETMGQDPFRLSTSLADQYATAGARAGQLYLQPQAAAANAYSQYQGYSPLGTALSGAGSAMGGGGFSSLFGGGSKPSYSGPSYGTNSSFDNSWFDTMSYD